jgi:hypothetical protein
MVVVLDNNADGEECTMQAVGKWMCGGRSTTGVSDLPKSNEALPEVSSLDDTSHRQRSSGMACAGCAVASVRIWRWRV